MKKKLLVILVLCCSLLLVGCNNKDTKKENKENKETSQKENNSLVGTWEYEEGYFTYVFNKDKTGSYDAAGKKMTFTYEVNGNKLDITYDDTKGIFSTEYKIEKNKLTIKDSMNNDVVYIKK